MTIQELINKEIEAIKNIPISIEDINKAITKIIFIPVLAIAVVSII